MEDANFWHLGGVTGWNSQFLKISWTFLAIICVASQLFLCLFWISLWVKNRCLQHPCFKNFCKIAQASKNSDSNAQHFLLDLLTHSWFHSMLFALPGYQFPYTVMNRCLYLTLRHWIHSPWSGRSVTSSLPTITRVLLLIKYSDNHKPILTTTNFRQWGNRCENPCHGLYSYRCPTYLVAVGAT
jgi:hypothetical protein